MMIKTIDLDKFHKDKSSSIHAEFEYLKNHDVIAIIDRNGKGKSVTNDIEWVLSQIDLEYKALAKPLKFLGLQHYKIIYKDSMGNWDLIKVDNEGKFIDFRPIKPGKIITDINEAFKNISDKAIPL